MKAAADHRLSLLVSFVILALSAPQATQQPAAPSSLETRAEREAFLSKATVSTDTPADGRRSWRASLASDTRKHDALVETADGSDPTRRDYRFNVAAYELDKLLRLDLVLPTVERFVSGRPAALTWWLDGVAMNELDRRRKAIDIPDLDSWRRQMDAVRIFDELISNTYRNTSPGLYPEHGLGQLADHERLDHLAYGSHGSVQEPSGVGGPRELKAVSTHCADEVA